MAMADMSGASVARRGNRRGPQAVEGGRIAPPLHRATIAPAHIPSPQELPIVTIRLLSTLATLAAATLALSATVAPAARAAEPKVLNIYNWSDYIADDTIKNFEKETGITV